MIHWSFKRPKCRARKANKGVEVPCTVKPDLDNAAKAVVDCLAKAGWFTDDAVVSRLLLCKTEGDNPRLDIAAKDDA
jgi:Holliday junction resolvase RusA-like endonuclease